jgi:hypothetical protein
MKEISVAKIVKYISQEQLIGELLTVPSHEHSYETISEREQHFRKALPFIYS